MYNENVCASVPNLPIHIGFSDCGSIGLKCENHCHDEIELLEVKKGLFSCTINGRTYEMSGGDVVFINSRIPHYTTILEAGTATVLIQINTDAFSNNDTGKYLSRFINNGENHFVLFQSNHAETKLLSAYIEKIKDEYVQKNHAYELYIKANIYNILAFLYRNKALIDIESHFDFKTLNKVMPILQYINNHYQAPITLKEISSVLNVNPYYFCRIFKKSTGSTFIEYLNFVRICISEKLLSTTEKTVMEICLETGFSSVSYFNRVFKKFKNCSPTVYRKIKYAQK